MNRRSLLTLEVSGVPSAPAYGRPHADAVPPWLSLLFFLILSLHLLVTNFCRNYFSLVQVSFFLNQAPLSISSFVPSSCFHGYLSLHSVHYLSLPPFPSLSLSLCSYLSHFAFISASLPPALSHTLLTPAFISLHFHLSFTFLSPSSLPFHHAGFGSYL